jgi:hypothetical protein
VYKSRPSLLRQHARFWVLYCIHISVTGSILDYAHTLRTACHFLHNDRQILDQDNAMINYIDGFKTQQLIISISFIRPFIIATRNCPPWRLTRRTTSVMSYINESFILEQLEVIQYLHMLGLRKQALREGDVHESCLFVIRYALYELNHPILTISARYVHTRLQKRSALGIGNFNA